MARYERYISDNPFRNLEVGSGTPMSVLRKKADAVARAASVGIIPKIPEVGFFGSIPLTELGSAVRSLEGNPERRTVYRLFWPINAVDIPLILKGEDSQILGGDPLELLHNQFLVSWYRFLSTDSPADAADALEFWQEISESKELQSVLAALIVDEDGVALTESHNVLRNAIKVATLVALERVSSAAARAWDEGETSSAFQLARVLLDSPTDDELEERALEPLANCAWRLHERVTELIEVLPAYHDGFPLDEPKEIVQLVRFGQLLSGRHPSATDWVKSSERWQTAVCWQMRKEALRLHNDEGRTTDALYVAKKALQLSTDSAQKEKLRGEVTVLESILQDEKKAAHFCSISKISSAPTLYTINGWGMKLYGRERFEGDRDYYFSTLYFVGFFIPIFPITRYLVKDASPSGWSFLGKSQWTIWMKLHLAFSITLIFIACYSLRGSDSVGVQPKLESGTSQAYSNYASSAPVSGPVQSPSDVPAIANITFPGNERRERLKKELESLKTQIRELDTLIEASETKLSKEKSNVEESYERIVASSPDRYNQYEVDDYNSMVRKYERQRKNYNVKVEDFNDLIYKRKRKVARHNEVVNALND